MVAKARELTDQDLFWVAWLNLQSLAFKDAGVARVPFLRAAEDFRALGVVLERIGRDGETWASPDAVEAWCRAAPRAGPVSTRMMERLAAGYGPEGEMSPELRAALLDALVQYALGQVECAVWAKSGAARVWRKIEGWEDGHPEAMWQWDRGVSWEKSKSRPAVVLLGDVDDMRLAERPLEEVIDWCAQACVWYGVAADWRPWAGDRRSLTVSWRRQPDGTWKRWLRLIGEKNGGSGAPEGGERRQRPLFFAGE